eukprot:jgi/Psemu1/308829/fgenesh1_kg.449_\
MMSLLSSKESVERYAHSLAKWFSEAFSSEEKHRRKLHDGVLCSSDQIGREEL